MGKSMTADKELDQLLTRQEESSPEQSPDRHPPAYVHGRPDDSELIQSLPTSYQMNSSIYSRPTSLPFLQQS